MARLEYPERLADDLAAVRSAKVERRVIAVLDSIEVFGGFGSKLVPESIEREFGNGVREVEVSPCDLICTFYPDEDLARIEALVHQKRAR